MKCGVGGVAPPEPGLQKILDAIDDFSAQPKGELDGEQRGNRLIHLRHAADLIELLFAENAAEFNATNEYLRQGSASPIDWIRHQCKMSGNAAADRVLVGAQIEELPQSTYAMVAGEIGFAHLSLIAHTAYALTESTTAVPFDETPLLERAREDCVGRFRHVCHHLRHAQDAAGLALSEAEAVELRRLDLSSGQDGMLYINGRLDSVGGAALRSALEPLARRSGADDDRRRERRLADALVDIGMHALDGGFVPRQAHQRAHLQVNTSLETFLGLGGAPAAELEYSLPISSAAVQRIACDCAVTRILLDSDSMVIDVGRAKRVVSGPMSKALRARDGGCCWPGCDRPASWTSAHHVIHWIHGGKTDLPNLVLLCYRHHWMVHEGGWQLVRGDDGSIITAAPLTILQQHLARAPDRVTAA
jgi:hypothetical protein